MPATHLIPSTSPSVSMAHGDVRVGWNPPELYACDTRHSLTHCGTRHCLTHPQPQVAQGGCVTCWCLTKNVRMVSISTPYTVATYAPPPSGPSSLLLLLQQCTGCHTFFTGGAVLCSTDPAALGTSQLLRQTHGGRSVAWSSCAGHRTYCLGNTCP